MNQYSSKVKLFKSNAEKSSHTGVEHIHDKKENIEDNENLLNVLNDEEIKKNKKSISNNLKSVIKEDIIEANYNEYNVKTDNAGLKDSTEKNYMNQKYKLSDVQSKIMYYLEDYYNLLSSSADGIKGQPQEINDTGNNKIRDNQKFFMPGYKNQNSILQHRTESIAIKNRLNEVKVIDDLDNLTYCINILKDKQQCDCYSNEYNLMPGLRILEAQEFERSRIARDLHDTTVQTLTNLVHRTELCMRLIDSDTIRVKLDLQVMMQCLKDVINDMRLIIYDLRPMSLDDLGLETTVSRFVSNLQLTTNIKIDCQVEGTLNHLDSVKSLTIYRIIQEATANSIKHSSATQIDILIVSTENTIQFSITDNGKGFCYNKNTRENSTNFGLSIMRERVYLLKGEIDIISSCNAGTKVIVSLPLD